MSAARWILCAAGLSVTLAFTPGCLVTNMRYTDPVSPGERNAITPSATACQTLCANSNVTCGGFTYYPVSGECWFSLSGETAKLHRQTPSEVRCYSGPVSCANPPPACPATITGTWPGATSALSDSAWSIGYQPSKLQCWPTYSYNGSFANCQDIETLDDTATGWPGKCLGLTQTTLSEGEHCEEKCKADVYCPGFQIGNDGSCWHGIGTGCYDQPDWDLSWTPIAAKRFQRGRVVVIKNFTGVQLMGLTKVFNKANADKMPNAALQCQKSCYSVLQCQYWQLSNASGCFIETPDNPVQNPLTSDKVSTTSRFAPDMIAGEFIQRMCTTPLTTTAPPTPPITTPLPPITSSSVFTTTNTTTTTTGGAGGFPWWGWLLLALLCCCCIAALAAFLLLGQKKSKKPKKGRKLTRGPPAQAPTPSVPLMQAQPVPTQLTAMPVYSAPPPVYTAVPAPMVATSRAIPMVAPQQPIQPVMMAPQSVSQFDMMDRNGDGVITRQEFQQVMGAR